MRSTRTASARRSAHSVDARAPSGGREMNGLRLDVAAARRSSRAEDSRARCVAASRRRATSHASRACENSREQARAFVSLTNRADVAAIRFESPPRCTSRKIWNPVCAHAPETSQSSPHSPPLKSVSPNAHPSYPSPRAPPLFASPPVVALSPPSLSSPPLNPVSAPRVDPPPSRLPPRVSSPPLRPSPPSTRAKPRVARVARAHPQPTHSSHSRRLPTLSARTTRAKRTRERVRVRSPSRAALRRVARWRRRRRRRRLASLQRTLT